MIGGFELRSCFWLLPLLLSIMATAAGNNVVETVHADLDAGERGAAIAKLDRHLATEPGDQNARFLYARVLAWEQRWTESLEQYDELLFSGPGNADYLLGKSQVLVWSGRPVDALPLLARARESAPHYEAVWRLEIQALQAIDDPGRDGELEALRLDARERFADSDWPGFRQPTSITAVRSPVQLSLLSNHVEGGFSVQQLSNNLPDWSSLYVHGGRRLGSRKSVYGQLRQTERFDETDHEVSGGVYWPVGDAWTVSTNASLAPGAVVLPKWTIAGQLQRPIEYGLGMQVGIRHSEYAANHVRMLTMTGDYYWKNYYAGWTVYWSKLEDADPTFANQFRFDRYYGDKSRIGFLFAFGKEVESVGNGLFITGDTLSAVLTGLHWMSPVWGVSWEVIFHEQGDAYRRGGVRVGLRRQF